MNQAILPTQTSTPNLTTFDPRVIPWQYELICDVKWNWDYDQGVHEALCSGSVGSAKSLALAHLVVTHCLEYPKARVLVGRKALTDLRETILAKILEHLEGVLIEKKDYWFNATTLTIKFANGSEIICKSWTDKRYKKFRSYELSAAIIEELTENSSDEFLEFYKEIRARVGRLGHIKESWIICATNPDAPSHAAYDYFIEKQTATRRVYYSITSDNPFLRPDYIPGLKEMYTEKECERMIYGRWIEITKEMIYYAWDGEASLVDSYKINEAYPVIISFDFNIGAGKPMSCSVSQYINTCYIFFDEVVVEGARTLNIMEELANRGIFDNARDIIIRGDCNGRNNSTAFNGDDYEVIESFLADHKDSKGYSVTFENDVPRSNPAVRTRHVQVNGRLKNANGHTHIFVVKSKCPMTVKGFRLTKLKKGGHYIEDDGPTQPWQHISTAVGYNITRQIYNDTNTTTFVKRKI